MFSLFARLNCSWYAYFYAMPLAFWDSAQACLVDVDIILEVEVYGDVEFFYQYWRWCERCLIFNHPNHGFNRAFGNVWRKYRDSRQITKSLKIKTKPKWRLRDIYKRMILFVVRIMPMIRLGACAAIFAYRLQCGWLHWLEGHCLPSSAEVISMNICLGVDDWFIAESELICLRRSTQ